MRFFFELPYHFHYEKTWIKWIFMEWETSQAAFWFIAFLLPCLLFTHNKSVRFQGTVRNVHVHSALHHRSFICGVDLPYPWIQILSLYIEGALCVCWMFIFKNKSCTAVMSAQPCTTRSFLHFYSSHTPSIHHSTGATHSLGRVVVYFCFTYFCTSKS
jgi:hypothetical protein